MVARVTGQPPGRAGRVWLDRRIAMASRGAGLLEQKLRILVGLEQRYSLMHDRTLQGWREALGQLDLWLARAGVVSGQRGVRLAGDHGPARVEVTWALTMGVKHPAAGTTTIPEPQGTDPVPDSEALLEARAAARRALTAAVDHAVARTAREAVRVEVAKTRRQLRAIETRRLPALRGARARLAMDLDDLEREEALRLRWAQRPHQEHGGRP